ncbi:MAG: NAD-dependent epimerase/dehydratase family protein, partial [Nitrospinales bacterium]
MKVLVTGGSGFIASHLIRRLLSKGLEVEALAREPGRPGSLENLKIKVQYAELSQPRSLNRIEGRWDAVVHT